MDIYIYIKKKKDKRTHVAESELQHALKHNWNPQSM